MVHLVQERLASESEVVSRDQTGAVADKSSVGLLVTDRIQNRLMEMITPVELLGRNFREIIAERSREQVEKILEDEKSEWDA
jgi:hypothetical protein